MKKLLLCFCIAVLLTVSCALAEDIFIRMTVDSYVYSDCVETANIVGYAFRGDVYHVISEKNGWYNIEYMDFDNAYVSSAYCKPTYATVTTAPRPTVPLATASPVPVTAKPTSTPEPAIMIRVTGGCNIRSGPDSSYEKIGYATIGDVYTSRGLEQGWYKILCNQNEVGYISAKYAEVTDGQVPADLSQTSTPHPTATFKVYPTPLPTVAGFEPKKPEVSLDMFSIAADEQSITAALNEIGLFTNDFYHSYQTTMTEWDEGKLVYLFIYDDCIVEGAKAERLILQYDENNLLCGVTVRFEKSGDGYSKIFGYFYDQYGNVIEKGLGFVLDIDNMHIELTACNGTLSNVKQNECDFMLNIIFK